MVSGSISPSYSEYFSPFLHSTGSLSVSQEYLALPDGAGNFKRGVSDPALLRIPLRNTTLLLQGSHLLWPRFPAGSPNRRIDNSTYAVLQPPSINTGVWAVPISLAATFGISVIYFPPGTEMVHFPGLAHTDLCIQSAVTRVHLAGFPHSEIPGSKPACGSPGLIAACHVLHRLLAPRHPPYALSSLIIKLTQSVKSFELNVLALIT